MKNKMAAKRAKVVPKGSKSTKGLKLADILKKVRPRTKHPETDWGAARGKEVW